MVQKNEDTIPFQEFSQDKEKAIDTINENNVVDDREGKHTEIRGTESKDSTDDIFKIIKTMLNKVEELGKKFVANTKKNNKASVINLSDVKKCQQPTILFLVTSHSSNKVRRKIIRDYWGYQDNFKKAARFLYK